MHNQLIHLITESVALSESERNLCVQYFEPVRYPKSRIIEEEGKIPGSVPKFMLYTIAGFMELMAKISGKPPLLTTKDIAMFSGLQQDFDISKSTNELGFNPKNNEQAVKEAMAYLMEHKKQPGI